MQFIDITISQQKYADEIAGLLSRRNAYRKRGILILHHEFPDVVLAFCVPHVTPKAISFAVSINFDNYDLEPLSVRFVDPFTWEKLVHIPNRLIRKIIHPDGRIEPFALSQQDRVGLPFICLPGVREYHNHAAHTGDHWLLHRNRGGEGTLSFLVEKLHLYGINSVAAYHFRLESNVGSADFTTNTCDFALDPNKIAR